MARKDTFPRPFGRYTLLANLAQGGMGALYLGCQGERGMEKLCVIKTVLPHLADKEYVARFRDEAKVVVRLQHGNLVPVYEAGVARTPAGEELYLAMEHVDGKDLRAVWNRCAKKGIAFPVDVAVYIARELARGLQHAHNFAALKLVHRDVSPPNVLLSYSGEVKLTDFGLATSTIKTEKTAPGIIYGKVSYMSPEQAKGDPLDGRTDLYAVCLILWELLTGRQLFPQSEQNLIERVRKPHIDPPSKHAARVPPELDAILAMGLAPEPSGRYPDCEALRAALSSYLAAAAPTTDNARVAAFLRQLFDTEIEAEHDARQRLVDELETKPLPKLGDTPLPAPPPLTPEGAGDVKAPLIGTLLDGRYQVRRLIGEGGMGLVYEAEHVEIGRRVAVKVLHPAYTRHPDVVSRFRSEARAATRIGHPHIIDVFDSGTTVDGAVYFVMEYLDGADLAEEVSEGAFEVGRAVAIARQICEALGAAHRAGIIHRDMKPENVFLIERDGRRDFVKVLDFGIAKTHDEVSRRIGPRLTSPGMAMGTPEYMAPEQAAGETTDARADVYAVGAILYEMLTMRAPHEGKNVLEVLTRKATVAPTPIEQLRGGVPAELIRLIMRTLALDPRARPQSMEELGAELAALAAITAPPLTQKVGRRPWVLYGGAVVATVVALVATGMGVSELLRPRPARPTPAPTLALATTPAPTPSPTLAPALALAATPAPAQTPKPSLALATPPKSARQAHPSSAARAAHPLNTASAARVAPPSARPVAPAPSHPTVADDADLAEAKRTLRDAREALVGGDLGQAERLFSEVEHQGLERGAALLGLGEVAYRRASYRQAARLAERSAAAGGGVGARLLLGNAQLRLDQYDDAAAAYREALRLDRGNAEARRNLELAESKKGGR